jgi:hypothetical protein
MSEAVINGDPVYLADIFADSPKGRRMASRTRPAASLDLLVGVTRGTVPGFLTRLPWQP